MNPRIGRRASYGNVSTEPKPSATREFVLRNTHRNITMKREFMYIEDVKDAININTLEERMKLKRWLAKQLKTGSSEMLLKALERGIDKDRHTVQKKYKITL